MRTEGHPKGCPSLIEGTMTKKVKITVVYEGTIPEDVTEEQLRERVCENLDDWFWSSEWNDDTKEDTIVERKDIKIEIGV